MACRSSLGVCCMTHSRPLSCWRWSTRALALACAWLVLVPALAWSAAPDKVRLQLKWYHQFQFAGYYAAQVKGFYRAEGLDVDILEGASDKSPEKMVLGKQVEFGVHDGADLVYRRLLGDPVVALASIFQHSPYVVISKKSSAIRHPADLVGRTVLITQDQGSAQILAMFRREGIKVSNTFEQAPVKFMPHTWNVLDVIESRADAMTAYLTEIPGFQRRYDFDPAVLNPVDFGIDFYGDTLFTRGDYLQANPELVERFRRASLQGWQYAMAHPEEIADHILTLASTRPGKPDRRTLLDEAQAMVNIVLPTLVEIGNMNPGRWEKMAGAYRELGMVTGSANLEGFSYEVDAEKREIRQRVEWLLAVLLGLSVLALGGFAWLRLLRAQVRSRTRELTDEVAERKRTEEALLESRQNLAITLNSIGDAVITTDAAGLITGMNPTAERLTAWPLADALGQPLATVFRIVSATTRAAVADPVQRVMERGEVVGLANHTVLLARDGREYQIADSAAPIRTTANTVVGVVLVFSDVSEKYRAEEALRIAATAFESQQGMSIANAQYEFLRVNKAFTAITGYSAEEAVGKTPAILASGRHDEAFHAAISHALANEGAWAGEIWNKRKNGEIYPEWLTISAVKDTAGVTTHFVSICSDLSERVRAQTQIDTLAFYDPLTHLPNRRLLLDRLEQALHTSTRHARRSALLFVDLDNFKTINDTLGHRLGDCLLVQVAQRLKTCIRDGDTLAHLGSDEFVVMLEDLSEDDIEAATQAETVADKILHSFVTNFSLDSGAYHGTSSIGITLFSGDTLESSEQPLKRAELAMFEAKAAGRNMLRFFDGRMQAEVSARAVLEADMREAVQQRQFVLHYQPQVVGAGRISGVEALVRWQHPQRGMVSPAEFIPLAEETGLILPLGQWVMEEACAQLAAWEHHPELSLLTIAVNVSARQFQQTDFVDAVQATLERTHARPRLLKLELTESMLVGDVEAVIAKMGTLKAHGVSFSLDDFGTGYSSLTYLKRLPLAQLKIDQGFVQNIVTDPNDAAIAKMVVALAESMGLAVIAEGVELQAQADFLAHLGCHAYQGYLFSRPLPLDALEDFALQRP